MWIDFHRRSEPVSELVATSARGGRIYVVGRKATGDLVQSVQLIPRGLWENWTSIPGRQLRQLAIATDRNDRPVVLGVDASGRVELAIEEERPGEESRWLWQSLPPGPSSPITTIAISKG